MDSRKAAVSPDLAEDFVHMILTLYYKMQEHPFPVPEIKLSSHAFHVLHILGESPDQKVPMAELVTKIRRTKQQLSKLVSDLEDDGLVSRIRTRENRRTVYVTLTSQGESVIRQAYEAMIKSMSQCLESLPEEKLSLIAGITATLNTLIKETQNERS